MAGTVPKDARALAEFALTHAPQWTAHAAAIGVPLDLAALVASLTPQLVEKIEAAESARLAAIAATDAMNLQARALFEASATAVRAIRTKALATGDGGIYPLARIDPPRTPRERADAPRGPRDVSFIPEGDGSLRLAWRVTQPRGVSNVNFEIRRRDTLADGTTTPMRAVGSAANGAFHDETIPLGIARVEYVLIPRRGTRVGDSSRVFSLQFGSPGNKAVESGGPSTKEIGRVSRVQAA